MTKETAMKTNLMLIFPGTCEEAFGFYEKVFGTERLFTMRFGEAPEGAPMPPSVKEASANRILHTAMPLGGITLMGCDSPAGQVDGISGFAVSVDSPDEAKVRKVFAELSEGGSVMMPLAKTFWSPLFGMLKDKYGVSWMVSIPGPQG
jgi:PhnB protein